MEACVGTGTWVEITQRNFALTFRITKLPNGIASSVERIRKNVLEFKSPEKWVFKKKGSGRLFPAPVNQRFLKYLTIRV